MTNKNYRKGRRKEYAIVKDLKEQGFLAFRSAGSHSPIDICAINSKTREIFLIQSKAGVFRESEKMRLYAENDHLNGFYRVSFKVE
jgi:Holliday junction resolvase